MSKHYSLLVSFIRVSCTVSLAPHSSLQSIPQHLTFLYVFTGTFYINTPCHTSVFLCDLIFKKLFSCTFRYPMAHFRYEIFSRIHNVRILYVIIKFGGHLTCNVCTPARVSFLGPFTTCVGHSNAPVCSCCSSRQLRENAHDGGRRRFMFAPSISSLPRS
jgi:hypothetical protein